MPLESVVIEQVDAYTRHQQAITGAIRTEPFTMLEAKILASHHFTTLTATPS